MKHMSLQSSQTKQNRVAAIQTQALSKHYLSNGEIVPVLDSISFDVEKGHILAVVGKSGSGKSTLLNIISGLEAASSGTVSTNGSLAYVPQRDLLLQWRTVLENILLPTEIRNGNLVATAAQARQLLAEYGLAEFETAYPNDISGGMRQKVSLIRTLIQDADLVLFDEPFSAIDFTARLQLVKEVRSYVVFAQKAAIFVTHSIEEAIAVSDELIVLGNRPAQIIYQTDVVIPQEYRDPVQVRKSQNFQALFEQIWKLLSKEI